VSQKTAIDLDTLGAPDNDSEGHGCYISEKGIQAAPAAIEAMEVEAEDSPEELGKYHGVMYICGKTYHIFNEMLLGEDMEPAVAMFTEFGEDLEYNGKDIKPSSRIPANPPYFESMEGAPGKERPVKTISYMTLTSNELPFMDIAGNSTFSFRVRDNIVALFSCNVIAFMESAIAKDGEGKEIETDIGLRFIKNPIFASRVQNNLTDRFPMALLSLRSWTPAWKGSLPASGDLLALREEPADSKSRLLLSEESVFVYNKDTRKILALRQIRRRIRADRESKYAGENFEQTSYDGMTMENKVYGGSAAAGNWFIQNFEYVNHLYLFTDENLGGIGDYFEIDDHGYLPVGSFDPFPIYYGSEFDGDIEPKVQISPQEMEQMDGDNLAGIGDIYLFHKYQRLKHWQVGSNEKHRIPFCFINSLDAGKNDIDSLKHGSANLKNPVTILERRADWLAMAWAHAIAVFFEDGDKIDDVLEKIKSQMGNMDLATPDNWARIKDSGDFDADYFEAQYGIAFSAWSRVWEIYGNAELWGADISYHTQKSLFGLRSRAFSIGTRIYSDINPYKWGNSEFLMEIRKWGTKETVGLETKAQWWLDGIAPIELAERTLKIRISRSNKLVILALPEWIMSELTSEYRNAVYFSDAGSFDINTTDQHYIVPSNVSDSITGMYGEDRDILLISSKSIERFNIADSSEEPISFVRLDKVYDYLIDWSGINSRLDTITKEKGATMLNGIKTVREIFNTESRIAPDTIWKTTWLRVIDCKEGDDRFLHLLDSQNRAFRHECAQPIFSLTSSKNGKPLLADEHAIYYCDWESGNPFTVEWSYRSERNILLGKISIRNAQHKPSDEKRMVRLWKDGKPIRERLTSHASIDFYKLGRGISSRLKVETSGYLREVAMTDTEEGQK